MSDDTNNWDDWGSPDDTSSDNLDEYWNSQDDNSANGNFVENSDNTEDYWGNQEQYVPNQDDYWDNQEQYVSNSDSEQDKKGNKTSFSPKIIAIILAGVFLVLALILFIISAIRSKPNNSGSDNQSVQLQTQQSTEVTSKNNNDNSNNKSSDYKMIEIPDSMNINYSGEVYDIEGTVLEKKRFKIGSQLMYDIKIHIVLGSDSETWNYYCGYNAYKGVSIGDNVVVSYQVPQEGYISINSVSK